MKFSKPQIFFVLLAVTVITTWAIALYTFTTMTTEPKTGEIATLLFYSHRERSEEVAERTVVVASKDWHLIIWEVRYFDYYKSELIGDIHSFDWILLKEGIHFFPNTPTVKIEGNGHGGYEVFVPTKKEKQINDFLFQNTDPEIMADHIYIFSQSSEPGWWPAADCWNGLEYSNFDATKAEQFINLCSSAWTEDYLWRMYLSINTEINYTEEIQVTYSNEVGETIDLYKQDSIIYVPHHKIPKHIGTCPGDGLITYPNTIYQSERWVAWDEPTLTCLP